MVNIKVQCFTGIRGIGKRDEKIVIQSDAGYRVKCKSWADRGLWVFTMGSHGVGERLLVYGDFIV